MIELKGNVEVQSYRPSVMGGVELMNKSALSTFGEIVASRAKQLVPSPTSPPLPRIGRKKNYKRTGALKSSIDFRVRKVYGGEGMEVRIFTGPGRNGFRYGLPVERGLPGRNYRNTPYMQPAFEESTGSLPNIMRLAAEREARIQTEKAIMRKAARRERQFVKRMQDVDLDF